MESSKTILPEGPLLYQYFEVDRPIERFVIFDRDGTLTFDDGYIHRVSDFRWMPGAVELLSYLNRQDVSVFIASNQSGVGRGYFTIEQMEAFNRELVSRALSDSGLRITAIAVCPHSPIPHESCVCRKPKIGLLLALHERFNFSKARGCLIGNSKSDLQAAMRFGLTGIEIGESGLSLVELVGQV